MAIYRVKAPDGTILQVQGPDGAAPGAVMAQARAMYPQHQATMAQANVKAGGLGGAVMSGLNAFENGVAQSWGGPLKALAATVDPTHEANREVGIPDNAPQKSVFGGTSFGDAYRANLALEQQQAAAQGKAHPIITALSGLAGGGLGMAAGGAALKPVMAGAPLAARVMANPVVASHVIGGVTGAINGAGAANPGTRVGGGIVGAALGTALGGAVGLTVDKALPALAHYVGAYTGNSGSITQTAMRQIVTALKTDGYDVSSPAGVLALKNELSRFSDKPVTLADVGNAMRARTGVALRTPNPAQSTSIDATLNRQAGSGARLRDTITDTVAPRTDVHAIDQALVDQRATNVVADKAAAMGPVANPALDAPVTPEQVQAYSQRPDVQAALNNMGHAYYGVRPEDAMGVIKNGLQPSEVGQYGPGTDFYNNYADAAAEHGPGTKVFSTPVSTLKEEYGLYNAKTNPTGKLEYDPSRGTYTVTDLSKNIAVAPVTGPQEPALPAFAPVKTAQVPTDQILQNIVNMPEMEPILAGAAKQANFEKNLLTATGQDTSHLPEFPEGNAMPDMKALDYTKRQMDRQVTSLYASGNTTDAVNMQNLRDALKARVIAANPEYGQYLSNYAASSDLMDSLHAGRDFTKLDPETITNIQAKGVNQSPNGVATPAQQEMYRVGAARNLVDTVNSTRDGAQPANRILNSDDARAQVAALGVSPQAQDALNTSVQQERALGQLTGQLQGSATDERLAARISADTGLSTAVPFRVSDPMSWVGAGLRKAAGVANLNANSGVNAQLLPRVLDTDPDTINRTIAALTAQGQKDQADALTRAAVAKYGAGIGGAAIGSPVQWQAPNQGN